MFPYDLQPGDALVYCGHELGHKKAKAFPNDNFCLDCQSKVTLNIYSMPPPNSSAPSNNPTPASQHPVREYVDF